MADLLSARVTSTQTSSPQTPMVWLEVGRGRTRYPRRPVLGDRLLIGAGSNCQLQLGGDAIPFLHSILTIAAGEVSIEAFVPTPDLLVNGQNVQFAVLHDGDEIVIADFSFLVHIDAEQLRQQVEQTGEMPWAEESEQDEISNLSAAELVARIEREQAQLDALEENQRNGIAALLDAVLLHGEAEQAQQMQSSEAAILEELNALSRELESRLQQIRQREEQQSQQAESLMQAQTRLADQLQRISGTLESEEIPVRATA